MSHSFINISSPNLQGIFMAEQNFTLILKNKIAAIADCLKIIKKLEILQLTSSNLHKRYMAG